jgi:hypothetical protein
VPSVNDRRLPTNSVPDKTGETVFTGANGKILDVAEDVAGVDPAEFIAVTVTVIIVL